MIYILVVLDMVSEMFAALTTPFLALPSAFKERQTTSFTKAWKEAINFRWRQREIAREHKLGIYSPEALEGAMVFWRNWIQWHGVNLDITEIERIQETYPGYDANGIASFILPLCTYAEKEWQRQRPWNYRWSKMRQRFRS